MYVRRNIYGNTQLLAFPSGAFETCVFLKEAPNVFISIKRAVVVLLLDGPKRRDQRQPGIARLTLQAAPMYAA
jgi:hypothetical protein